MDKLMGFGIKHALGRWRVVEIRSNPTGVRWQHQQGKHLLELAQRKRKPKGKQWGHQQSI